MSAVCRPPETGWSPVTIPDAQMRPMSFNGVSYRVSVAFPIGTPPPEGFPVMYVLDANAVFAGVVETHRRLCRRPDATGVCPAIIVGLGHDGGKLYDPAQRERDYTPRQLDPSGDAETFFEFIETILKPEIKTQFPVNPSRQSLAGHSLSAYFTLWAMIRYPGQFQNYIAVSPSLWRDNTLKAAVRRVGKEISRVFIAAGEWEEALPPWQEGMEGADDIAQRRISRRMIGNAREFATALGAQIGFERVRFELFSEEDHASVVGVAVSRAMRAVFSAAYRESCLPEDIRPEWPSLP